MKGRAPRVREGVAVVTGGGSGIGRALCEALASGGAEVVVVDLHGDDAEDVAASIRGRGGRAESVALDVRDGPAVRALLERVAAERGRLDFVFNNAGISIAGEVLDGSQSDWDRIFDVNLRGVVHGVLPAYEIMARQGFGHIVNTASTAGLTPTPGMTAYSASKHAVVGLSVSLRAEAELHGVRVSVVCPGLIETPMKQTMELRKVDRAAVLALLPVAFYPPEALARDVLRGVAANRAIIVAPLHARFAWWSYRFAPWIVRWFAGRTVRRARAKARLPG